MALMGNDERVSAETAMRIGLVSEVVAPDDLWTRHTDRGHHRRQAAVGDAGHGQGDLGVTGQAIPGRDGAEPDLRLVAGNPVGARPSFAEQE